MGLTPRQVLTQVEWPLALPSIVSGLRVAVVIGVGTATIASAIGAGGLGDYIFRGLAMVDSTVILAGAVPAALLALACDARARARRAGSPIHAGDRRAAAVALAADPDRVRAAPRSGRPDSANRRDVIVGSKNFTEQIVLGEMLAQVDRAAGRECRAAIQSWRHRDRAPGAHQRRHRRLCRVFRHVADRHLQPAAVDGLERGVRAGSRSLRRARRHGAAAPWLQQHLRDPRPRRRTRERLGLEDDRRSRTSSPDARAGFGYEFLERPDGFTGLSAAYGLQFAGQPRTMDLNLIYRAVAAREIDVTAGDATSGQIESLHLVVLDDDRHYFPVYDAVPLVRASVLLQHPEVGEALRRLDGAISAAEMRRMNYAVDGEKQDPFQVARAFLDKIERFDHAQP